MARPASFNQWLKILPMRPEVKEDSAGPELTALRALASKWETRRGRLTAASVEARAVEEYQAPPGTGAAAYNAYLAAVTPLTTPTNSP